MQINKENKPNIFTSKNEMEFYDAVNIFNFIYNQEGNTNITLITHLIRFQQFL